jgi:hypothetical protein
VHRPLRHRRRAVDLSDLDAVRAALRPRRSSSGSRRRPTPT